MKKLVITAFFVSIIIVGFSQKQYKVVATASMIGDMAENISGGLLDVETIVPIGGDPHVYDPNPKDAQMVAGADLILKNGLTFEGWLDELIENSGTKAQIVTVTAGIKPIASLQYKNSTDPHAWMDVSNGMVYIENVKNALAKLDPDNSDIYEFNFGVYKQQLEDLDEYITEEIKKIPERQRILITSHDAFQYYGRRYGIQLESILGTSTDAEVQTSDIINLKKVIKENDIPAVFIESSVNPKLLRQIAADSKVKIGGKLYADSIGDKDSPAPTYLDMVKYDTDVIVKALIKSQDETVASDSGVENEDLWSFILYVLLGVLLIGGFFVVYKNVNN